MTQWEISTETIQIYGISYKLDKNVKLFGIYAYKFPYFVSNWQYSHRHILPTWALASGLKHYK